MCNHQFVGSLADERLDVHAWAFRNIFGEEMKASGRLRCGRCRRLADHQKNRDYECQLTRADGRGVPAFLECKADQSSYPNFVVEAIGGAVLERLPSSLRHDRPIHAKVGEPAWTVAQSLIDQWLLNPPGAEINLGLLLSPLRPGTLLSYFWARRNGNPYYVLRANDLQEAVIKNRRSFDVLAARVQTWSGTPYRSVSLRVPVEWVKANAPATIVAEGSVSNCPHLNAG